MVNVVKSREIFSHADGHTYTSTREYEKSLHVKDMDVMTDRKFRETKEKLNDEARSVRKEPERYNHVHIDFANGRVTKSVNKDI